MDELVTRLGDREGLLFEIAWADSSPRRSAASATRGSLRILVGGFPVWFGESSDIGFDWTWIEILEFLGRSWAFIALQDSLPFGLQTSTPSRITSEAERYFERLPILSGYDAEAEFEAFLEVHDLSRGVQGALLPPLIFFGVGRHCAVSSEARLAMMPSQEVLSVLEQLGDILADRVANLTDPRSLHARALWDSRWNLSVRERLAISTGLKNDQLDAIEQGRSSDEVWELSGEFFESNELIAAARLSGWLEAYEIRQIMDLICRTPYAPSTTADALSDEARAVLQGASDPRPWEEGYKLGYWLRERIGHSISEPLDPEVVLEGWGVPVRELDLLATGIDAVACWGGRHGPTVFLNSQGRHSQGTAGRRSTLAHEIAHLLLDRLGALPLVDVLGGNMSAHVEARARAFAAELLLPRQVAGDAFANSGAPPKEVLKRLRRRYGVSGEVVAWQARNYSAIPLAPASRVYLRTQVSRPSDF